MVEIKKVLFPLDLSSTSAKLLPYAISTAQHHNAKLVILNVVQNLTKWETWIPHPSLETFSGELATGAKRAMGEFLEEHEDELKSCADYEAKTLNGDPATEIINVIEGEKIDLVVMGTHGRKGLEHTIFGSVAENVVRKSPVPVMTINPHKV